MTILHLRTHWSAGVFISALILFHVSFTARADDTIIPATTPSNVDVKQLKHAQEEIEKYHDHISAESQQAIIAQKVILGMSPWEASLAAGAYVFQVQADPSIWPPGADPIRVILVQSTHPDNSKIRMTFETATQFPDQGRCHFTVAFEQGRAIEIKKIGP